MRWILPSWGRVLSGYTPALSIEITRECPLRCPGCYAYEPEHLQGTPLRDLTDHKGDDLVQRVLQLVDKYKPVHLSIVGGEPLVRFRELSVLLPQLSDRGVAVQVVTSAVREIPKEWNRIKELYLSVSIDGLQPEHDARRKPATYERILRNIKGHRITVHCTVTSQTAARNGYYEEFLDFWSQQLEVKQIWMSLFTPQIGSDDVEILSPGVRQNVIDEFVRLRKQFPKFIFPKGVANAYRRPPPSPTECMNGLQFSVLIKNAPTTMTSIITASLRTTIMLEAVFDSRIPIYTRTVMTRTMPRAGRSAISGKPFICGAPTQAACASTWPQVSAASAAVHPACSASTVAPSATAACTAS